MSTVLIVAAVVIFWCLVPIPFAIAIGRSFRAGAEDDADRIDESYDAAGEETTG